MSIESPERYKDSPVHLIVYIPDRWVNSGVYIVFAPAKQSAICWREEGIHPRDVAEGVNTGIRNQCSQGGSYRLGEVAHPFARMAKATQSCGKLWGPAKPACSGPNTLEKDSADAAQCGPLHNIVLLCFAGIHNPITVSLELLERIRVEILDRAIAKTEHLAEGEPLGPVEGFLLMQSRTHFANTTCVVGNVPRSACRDNVISADTCLRTQRHAGPTINQRQYREGKRSTHKDTPLQGDHHVLLLVTLKGSETGHLLLVLHWEVTKPVTNIMRLLAYSQRLGRKTPPGLPEPGSRHTAEYGVYRIMIETVSGFCEVCRKKGLTFTQCEFVALKILDQHLVVNRLNKWSGTSISFQNRWPDLLTTKVSKGKHTRRRDGYDSRLAALFCNHRSFVNWDTRLRIAGEAPGRGEIADGHQAASCLSELGVLPRPVYRPGHDPIITEWITNLVEPVRLLDTAQSRPGPSEKVVGCWVPWNRLTKETDKFPQLVNTRFRLTSGLSSFRVRIHEWPTQVTGNEMLEEAIITSSRTRPTTDSVLTARRKSYATFSQLSSCKGLEDILLQLVYRTTRHVPARTEGLSVVIKSFRGSGPGWLWKSPCAPGESKCTPRLSHRKPPEPPLDSSREFGHEVNVAVRECNVTNGSAQRFHCCAHPVNPARARVGYPLPEFPTTTLLRNTTGNQTRPHRLPDASVVVDYTPMGLRATTLISGVARGTYYSAKKKHR
jgi:hypothetical protein